MSNSELLYNEFTSLMQKIADLRYAAAVLQWDQETYLPAKGADARARQLATLAEAAHEKFTSVELGNLLRKLEQCSDLDFVQRKNVLLTLEEYEKQNKLSAAFVHELSVAVSASFYAWIDARKQNDFTVFQPALEKLLHLKLQEAELKGYQSHPYDAMLQDYEKSASVAMLDNVFNHLKQPLKKLIEQAVAMPWPDGSFIKQYFNKEKQWEWGLYLIESLGFDMQAGRQDISEHPFTTNFSAKDVRLTTRIDEHDLMNMTWSCIHEAGHGLYEQGLPDAYYGLPAGEYASLSIHESQSRIWENCVGRNLHFWKYYLPQLQQYFPQLNNIDVLHFTQTINKVQPSLIRTEADELTYHFHVMIRYELEKMLFEKQMAVKDIRDCWNSLYAQYLHVKVPDDVNGCLQDVHWSHGSFGYFPTYSLGSLYAAQFWITAQKQLPELENNFEKGLTSPFLQWLRQNVHRHGKLYNSNELCEQITGEPLSSNYFIEYYTQKLKQLFP